MKKLVSLFLVFILSFCMIGCNSGLNRDDIISICHQEVDFLEENRYVEIPNSTKYSFNLDILYNRVSSTNSKKEYYVDTYSIKYEILPIYLIAASGRYSGSIRYVCDYMDNTCTMFSDILNYESVCGESGYAGFMEDFYPIKTTLYNDRLTNSIVTKIEYDSDSTKYNEWLTDLYKNMQESVSIIIKKYCKPYQEGSEEYFISQEDTNIDTFYEELNNLKTYPIIKSAVRATRDVCIYVSDTPYYPSTYHSSKEIGRFNIV